MVFTSDNGPWLIKGADGGSAKPLRGGKGSTWEGGVRVPTLAWWPGKIAPKSTSDAVAGTIDLLPTLVALAGGKVPAEPVIDGRDLSPVLFGKSKDSPREAHYYFAGYNLQAVRQGPWKLAIAPQPEPWARRGRRRHGKAPRLYNLDQEIGEQTNVAGKHPEIVAKLQALADKMGAEVGGTTPTARRSAGQVANPRTLYLVRGRQSARQGGDEIREGSDRSDIRESRHLSAGGTLDSANAPQVGGQPFTVSCTVETRQRDGVLLAHGGLSAGYVLHLKGGRVAFLVRTGGGDAFTEITTPDEFAGSAPALRPRSPRIPR